MRLLLEESVPSRLRRTSPNHVVKTVVKMGWGGFRNGNLMGLAAADFDALVTVDKNLPYQQNLSSPPISIVVLDAYSNELSALLPLVPGLEKMLATLAPGSYAKVVA